MIYTTAIVIETVSQQISFHFAFDVSHFSYSTDSLKTRKKVFRYQRVKLNLR